MANAWMTHLAKYWAKNKGKMSYSTAMKEAKKTYSGKQSSIDKKDESKGMKGQVKGSKSKSKRDFETEPKSKRSSKETVELDANKITFKKGGLHRSLQVPEDYTHTHT